MKKKNNLLRAPQMIPGVQKYKIFYAYKKGEELIHELICSAATHLEARKKARSDSNKHKRYLHDYFYRVEGVLFFPNEG